MSNKALFKKMNKIKAKITTKKKRQYTKRNIKLFDNNFCEAYIEDYYCSEEDKELINL